MKAPHAALVDHFKDQETAERWIRSAHGLLRSRSFAILLGELGSLDACATWLAKVAPTLPRQDRLIERIHVWVKSSEGQGRRRTSVSLDLALYQAMVDKVGSQEEAVKWLRDLTMKMEPAKVSGGFSRAVQREIVQLISGQAGRATSA